MTIGNIPKHIRRKPSRQAQVLLGYLPTSKLEHITNKAARRRSLANLFHACLSVIMGPLEVAGVKGITVKDGSGVVRRGHPILAAYIGDYPEQVLVTCVKSTDCPTCPTSRNELGNPGVSAPRPLEPIQEALESLDQGATAFRQNCGEAGVKPIQSPFWINLPFVHIHQSITPDVLHQLYQGVLKHLISWIKSACGPNEIDARCRRLPPNHHIRVFLKGISHLSRVTGTEHDQILRFLLGIILDIKLPGNLSNARLLKAVRGILDFLFLAKYPFHTSKTLDQMESALGVFHSNKEVFIQLGIRQNFNLPKLHFLGHYRELFEIFGTSDNFNTEYTERLHIDMAKDAYRSTNSKDEYPQMAAWLDRKERILCHDKYIRRRLAMANGEETPTRPGPQLVPPRTLKMARSPSASVLLDDVEKMYSAPDFKFALAKFIVQYNNPDLSKPSILREAAALHIPFHKIPVYHRVKFVSTDFSAEYPLAEIIVDSVHVEPERVEAVRGTLIPSRFDTALIRVSEKYSDSDANIIKGEWVPLL
jgi:Plavaka transposase